MNAAAVDAAGLEMLNMSHTLNTDPWNMDQTNQAPSIKLQAGGWALRRQASKKKLDKSSGLGYCRSQGQVRDGMAIDICEGPLMGQRNSAAEILQLRGRYDRQEKIPARARNGSCRVMVPDPRTSIKHQADRAPSCKLQAPSSKPQA